MSASRAKTWVAKDTAELLAALRGETNMAGLAKVAQVDRTTVSRWLRGTTEPSVPELLRCIDALTHRLVEWVALFVEPSQLPCVAQLAVSLEMQRRMAYEEPWSHAILRALELKRYRSLPTHVQGVLAQAVGVEVADELRLLAALRRASLVRFQRGKWRAVRVLTVDTRADAAADQRVKEHWAEVALARLKRAKPQRESFFSYNLCAVSHADFARIRELHLEYYERARRIVAESNSAERVLLLNQQLVPLDE